MAQYRHFIGTGFQFRFSMCFLVLFLLLSVQVRVLKTDGITFRNPIRFPYGGPFMGLFLAIAVPLEHPVYNIFLSYNIEANYNLPENQTDFSYPPIVSKRSLIHRKNLYEAIENKIEMHGYPGRQCLLRMICEVTSYSFRENGILGDLIRVILTPSSSKDEDVPSNYYKAEKQGNTRKRCKKYKKDCPISLLDLISVAYDMIQ